MEGVCYQEQEVQPYLDADVTCNLTERGREVTGLPTRPEVDAVGCLSPGQGVIASQGMGSSSFSPGRRDNCRKWLLGRDYTEQGQGACLWRLAGPGSSLAWAE